MAESFATAAKRLTSPANLVAIAHAAHRIGDRSLLASSRRVLRTQFGIEIRFAEPTQPRDPEPEGEPGE